LWRNPKYFPTAETPATPTPAPAPGPPEDRGDRLLTLPRNDGAEELRVVKDEYQGHPYLSLRLWRRGEDGSWYPTPKGCSIRMSECCLVADVLQKIHQGRTSQRTGRQDWRQNAKLALGNQPSSEKGRVKAEPAELWDRTAPAAEEPFNELS
jgi:hypothetical protein